MSSFIGFVANFTRGVFRVIVKAVSLVFSILAAAAFILAGAAFVALVGLSIFGAYYVNENLDVVIESGEYFFRCIAFPVYDTIIFPIFDQLRDIFNPLVCWYDAATWIGYGLYRQVLLETLQECGLFDILVAIFDLFRTLLSDVVLDYILLGEFFDEPLDATNICADLPPVFIEAQNIVCCACDDLCEVLRTQPGLIPMALPLPLPNIPFGLLSDQWTEVETCNYLFDFLNAGLAVFRQLWRVLTDVLRLIVVGSGSVTRPDFAEAADFWCSAAANYAISFEKHFQRAYDRWIPLPNFVFEDWLRWYGTANCIIGKAVSVGLKILLNIDRVVQYPSDQFWEDPLRTDIAEVFNLIGPVTIPTFALSTTSPPSPIFQKTRLTDDICLFILRILCDPAATDMNNICNAAVNMISITSFNGFNFDFICCVLENAVSFVLDAFLGIVEFTYHIQDLDGFFLYLDTDVYDQVDALKTDLVNVIDCVAALLALVPEVGPCLQDLITLLADIIISFYVFIGKVILGLLTLPYFLTQPMPRDNYLTDDNRATADLDYILFLISGDPDNPSPRSIANCVCVLLNKGLAFPRIGCPTTCEARGFIDIMKKKEAPKPRYKPRKEGWVEDLWAESPHIRSVFNQRERYAKLHIPDPFATVKESLRRAAEKNNGTAFTPLGLESMRDIDIFIERALNGTLKRPAGYRSVIKDRMRKYKLPYRDRHVNFTIEDWAANYEEYARLPGTTSSCGTAEEPTANICFDLCCIIRQSLILSTDLIRLLVNFINGLARGSPTFIYFTGGDFQAELLRLVDSIFSLPICAADFVELVFPVPGLDIEAPLEIAADLAQLILSIFIQSIFEFVQGKDRLTGGSCNVDADCTAIPGSFCCSSFMPDALCQDRSGPGTCITEEYPYFTAGEFLGQIEDAIDLTQELVDALCCILQAFLPIPGLDVCCIFDRYFDFLLEVIRFLLQIVLSLGTIFATGDQYFRNTNIDAIPFIIQSDVILDTIFGAPTPCGDVGVTTCAKADDGLINCVCDIINIIIPSQPTPSQPVAPGNCPQADLCCIIRESALAVSEASKFSIRLLASLWQVWPVEMGNKTPRAFLDFFFCDEDATSGPLFTASCGRLNPTIDALINILSDCPCAIFGFVDQLLPFGAGCFCGGRTGSSRACEDLPPGQEPPRVGIFREIPDLARIIVKKIVQLVRNLPNAAYWQNPPCDPSVPVCTWAVFFFEPIASKACTAVASLGCLVFSLLPGGSSCEERFDQWFGGIVRWAFEIVIRAVDFLIGTIDAIAGGDSCTSNSNLNAPGNTVTGGVDAGCLTDIVERLLTLPIDIFIADPTILDIGNAANCPGSCDVTDMSCPACDNSPQPSGCPCPAFRLPRCGDPGDNLRVNGLITGLARYLACMSESVLGSQGLRRAFDALYYFLSIIWQISDRLVGAFVAFINFFIGLFSRGAEDNCACHTGDDGDLGLGYARGGTGFPACYPICDPMGFRPAGTQCRELCDDGTTFCLQPRRFRSLCGFLATLEAFGALIKSVFTIFIPPPIAPNLRKRSAEDQYPFESGEPEIVTEEQTSDSLTMVLASMSDFSVTDCITEESADAGFNFTHCICRNLGADLNGDLCVMDEDTGIWSPKDLHPSTKDFIDAIAAMFTGSSACTDVIHDVEGKSWSQISFAERFEYVTCLEKHIQGHRLHKMVPVFPPDFFHRPDGLLALRNRAIEIARVEATRQSLKVARKLEELSKRTPQRVKVERAVKKEREEKFQERRRRQLNPDGTKDPHIIEQVIRLDALERKWKSEEFAHSWLKAKENIADGKVFPTFTESSMHFARKLADVAITAYYQPYRKVFDASVDAVTEGAKDIDNVAAAFWEHGVSAVRIPWDNYWKWYNRGVEETIRINFQRRQRGEYNFKTWDETVHSFYEGPFYKWWSKSWKLKTNPLWPIYDHTTKVMKERFAEDTEPNKVLMGVKKAFTDFKNSTTYIFQVKWTDEKWHRYEKLQAMGLYIWKRLNPSRITHDMQKRIDQFVNCLVLTRSLELIGFVFEYCINEFVVNLPPEFTAKRDTVHENLKDYSKHFPEESYFGYRSERGVNTTVEWVQRTSTGKATRKYPKIIKPPKERARVYRKARSPQRNRRTRVISEDIVGNFNLIDWVVESFQDLFTTDLADQGQTFFEKAVDWFENDNTDPADCPNDVGFKYWLEFLTVCRFPENIDCANDCGIGLPDAVYYIGIASIITFLLIPFIFPQTISILATFSAIVLFLIALPAVAWHYSPACWLLSPTIPGLPTFRIPAWPFPIGLPVLPFCIMDDLLDLIGLALNQCPLEPLADCETTKGTFGFCLLPGSVYLSAICQSCPDRIDIVNCKDVGLSDGLDNLIYILEWAVPGFADFFLNDLHPVCTTGVCLIPGVVWDHFKTRVELYSQTTDFEDSIFRWCFWATILSIVIIIGLIILVFLLVYLILVPLVALVFEIIGLGLIVPTAIFSQPVGLPGSMDPGLSAEDEEILEELRREKGQGRDNVYDLTPAEMKLLMIMEGQMKRLMHKEQSRRRGRVTKKKTFKRIRRRRQQTNIIGDTVAAFSSGITRAVENTGKSHQKKE